MGIASGAKMMAFLAMVALSLLAQTAVAAPSAAAAAAASPAASPWGSWWQRWQTAECPGPGAFPDTSDACSPVFRICVYMGPVRGLQPIPKSCPAGFVFNVVTGCTFKQECFQKLYPQAAAGWTA
ncbi:uncharacterized protein LOC126145031 isoform X1 [Schistocerca cancellata]|uniref:uncharacterized protein LOC126145031 isoform X1 n=1 Tax=Schistocerca cancellata TaxID=274614 RepID=UPI0021198629|nr:uncharacterized protein LOC126145031 isoform X1 [Schistocerca cancellata]